MNKIQWNTETSSSYITWNNSLLEKKLQQSRESNLGLLDSSQRHYTDCEPDGRIRYICNIPIHLMDSTQVMDLLESSVNAMLNECSVGMCDFNHRLLGMVPFGSVLIPLNIYFFHPYFSLALLSSMNFLCPLYTRSVQKIKWIFKFFGLRTFDFWFLFCIVMLVHTSTTYVDIVSHFPFLFCFGRCKV